MNLLVIGDIAPVGEEASRIQWKPPTDLVIGDETRVIFNWELPVGVSLNPVPRSSGPRIIAGRDSVRALLKWAPGFATLATNHIMDAGFAGLHDTLSSLHQAGFATVGAGFTRDEITRPLVWDTPDGTLAVINWVFRETHPEWMAIPGPCCWPGVVSASQTVKEAKRYADWVLCIVHWSDEDFAYPRPEDRSTGSALIRAGADCVIGHHPHVVRGREILDGRPIFYSVGNFFFSDIADGRGGWTCRQAPRNREGLGVLMQMRRGEQPRYEVRSFWAEGAEVKPDLTDRARKRMVRASRPLDMPELSGYGKWYEGRRARFDRWSYRWHFGVRRLGFRGVIRRTFGQTITAQWGV